jgi:hypothetical protein
MGVHATQVEDHQEQTGAQKQRAEYQREDTEQGAHRT